MREFGIFVISNLWQLWQHLQVLLCPQGDSAPGSAPPPPWPGSGLEGAGILLSSPTNKLLLVQPFPRQELPAQRGIRQNTEGGAAELSGSTSRPPPPATRGNPHHLFTNSWKSCVKTPLGSLGGGCGEKEKGFLHHCCVTVPKISASCRVSELCHPHPPHPHWLSSRENPSLPFLPRLLQLILQLGDPTLNPSQSWEITKHPNPKSNLTNPSSGNTHS